jgi:peptide/nickel transport system permease protein
MENQLLMEFDKPESENAQVERPESQQLQGQQSGDLQPESDWSQPDEHQPKRPQAVKSIAAFIAKNAVRMVSLFIAVTIISFALANMAPIDPIDAYVGSESSIGQEQRDAIAEHWGFNDPPIERYALWISHVFTGDWGISVIYHRPVLDVISERFLTSLALMGTAWVLSGIFGFVLGVVSGVFRGRWPDKLIKTVSLAFASAPVFWLALLALSLFAVALGWFPTGLAAPAGVLAQDINLTDRLYHLVLPAAVLSVSGIASITLQTREKTIESLQSDYAVFARARGEGTGTIVFRHSLRNIILPAITLQFASIAELFGGSFLAEQVFSYPGLGYTATAAALNNDIPLLLAVVLCSVLFVFTGNLIANVIYGFVDPRIRQGSEALDG